MQKLIAATLAVLGLAAAPVFAERPAKLDDHALDQVKGGSLVDPAGLTLVLIRGPVERPGITLPIEGPMIQVPVPEKAAAVIQQNNWSIPAVSTPSG